MYAKKHTQKTKTELARFSRKANLITHYITELASAQTALVIGKVTNLDQ